MSVTAQISLLKKRRTKIISTIGPASSEPASIKKLIEAGTNVFRLNMSHGDHSFHKKAYHNIRAFAAEQKRPIGILADLCGPKIRTGKFEHDTIKLVRGRAVAITVRNVKGTTELIPSQYRALANDVRPKDRILLSDGKLELEVKEVVGTEINCKVIHGGALSNYSGINLPNVRVSTPSLTSKDKKDARFMMGLGVDFLALSFVRNASDIELLRKLVAACSGDVAIIAKIEKPEALEEIDAILDIADGIMVARGDLGIELNLEQVPLIQHQLIDRAREKFKPVIVATQMLESMISNARPTRAEVSDVSNAVTMGADAVMLSGETAIGLHPLSVVRVMGRIIRQTEAYLWKQGYRSEPKKVKTKEEAASIGWAMADAVARLTHNLQVHAVIVISKSGMSVATMSSVRPAAPIIAIMPTTSMCRKTALLWSVIPIQSKQAGRSNPNQLARQLAVDEGLAKHGEKVLLIRGFHSAPLLNMPSVTVLTI